MVKFLVKQRIATGISWGQWKTIAQSRTIEHAEALGRDVRPDGTKQVALFRAGKRLKWIRES